MLKSEIASKAEHSTFPKIMRADSGCTVLFERPGTGVCLHPGATPNRVGHYASDWDRNSFKEWRGTITLTQD